MASVIVSELFSRARDAADQTDKQFVTDIMLLRWLNEAIPELDTILGTRGMVVRPTRLQIPVTGASFYTVPDCIFIYAVHVLVDNGKRLSMIQPVTMDMAYPVLPGRDMSGDPSCYYVEFASNGSRSIFLDSGNTGSILVTYLANSPAVVLTDSINYPAGAEGWLVAKLARKMMLKEEGDTRPIDKELADFERRVDALMWNQNKMSPAISRNPLDYNGGYLSGY
jgi:hypothetical protein